jgi:hypothetical protein
MVLLVVKQYASDDGRGNFATIRVSAKISRRTSAKISRRASAKNS